MNLRYRIEMTKKGNNRQKFTQVLSGSIGEYKDTLLCLSSIYIPPPLGMLCAMLQLIPIDTDVRARAIDLVVLSTAQDNEPAPMRSLRPRK